MREICDSSSELPPIVFRAHYAEKARYHTKLTEIDPVTRGLLEKYSKIPPDQVLEHVFGIVSSLRPLSHNLSGAFTALPFRAKPLRQKANRGILTT